jgi:hypothetical protein
MISFVLLCGCVGWFVDNVGHGGGGCVGFKQFFSRVDDSRSVSPEPQGVLFVQRLCALR